MNGFAKGIGILLVVCAAILAMCGILNDSTPQPTPEPTYELNLDCTNAAEMHAWGLPTKADVMQYHVHGQWGFYQDGALMAFDDLPGMNDRWDRLYGIEDNPAFDK